MCSWSIIAVRKSRFRRDGSEPQGNAGRGKEGHTLGWTDELCSDSGVDDHQRCDLTPDAHLNSGGVRFPGTDGLLGEHIGEQGGVEVARVPQWVLRSQHDIVASGASPVAGATDKLIAKIEMRARRSQ
jgi:hypothetical protein